METADDVTVPNLGSLPVRKHTTGVGKKAAPFHTNTLSSGPCHYYRHRSGQRLIFRENEIRFVDPTPAGAIVETIYGSEYKVTCPRPEQIVPGEAT